jgi:hypothetical protein
MRDGRVRAGAKGHDRCHQQRKDGSHVVSPD